MFWLEDPKNGTTKTYGLENVYKPKCYRVVSWFF